MFRLMHILALLALVAAGAVQAQTVEYIHTDALGSPVAVTDASGAIIQRTEYAPYGEQVNRPITDGPGFTGHVSDVATGLSYMQQRYYDPSIGRMLSVDPVTAYSSGDMRHLNRYAYAFNNPYKFIDLDGRAPDTIIDAGFIVYDTGRFLGAAIATIVGAATGNQSLQSAGMEGMRDTGIDLGASVASAVVPGLAAPVARGALNGAEAVANAAKVSDNARGTIYVDSKGNAIPTPPGGKIEGSPDGRFVQAKGADGKATGVRIDGGHKPSTHPDTRAQQPHAHVPGVKNADGTPWLPVKQKEK